MDKLSLAVKILRGEIAGGLHLKYGDSLSTRLKALEDDHCARTMQ
jgi:hypothetical protein